MGAFARARDSFALPVIADTSAIRAQEEGRCNVRPHGRKYAPRRYRRPLLAWRRFRHITSVHYSERVVHKALNRYALAPAIWPTLAPGCTANIKGRGTDFAISRLKQQLVRHYQKHGAEGYVLLVDFSNFFGNIDHAATKRLIDRALDDERIKALMYAQVDSHGIRGLGLGSEPNQILAVALPSPVDHMLLRTPCVLASGRYMDDLYCIALDKADLRGVLADIRRECAKLGIVVNEKKTRIVKLTRGFTFLKKRFNYG